jgi:hypothetical protein
MLSIHCASNPRNTGSLGNTQEASLLTGGYVRTLRSLTGNGALIVAGKAPVAVAYSVTVFVSRLPLRDGSMIEGEDSAAGTVVAVEPVDWGEYSGDRASLQLEDGSTWNCVVVDDKGRLEHLDGPTPGALTRKYERAYDGDRRGYQG